MTDKKPSFQFYPGDWKKDPALSMCSAATRGIWMDLLCAMHELGQCGEITGSINQLCALCRCGEDEMIIALEELADTKAALIENGNKKITENNKTSQKNNSKITVINRRMAKAFKVKNDNRLRQRLHKEKKKSNTDVTPSRARLSSSSSSTSVKKVTKVTTESAIDITNMIENIYLAYPKQAKPILSKRSIARAIKKITPEDLLSKVKEYSIKISVWQEMQYIPNAETWFDGEQWLDDPRTWENQSTESTENESINPEDDLGL